MRPLLDQAFEGIVGGHLAVETIPLVVCLVEIEQGKNWQAAHPDTNVSQLTQGQLAQYLSTAGMPNVDFLIRTGGEQRISNFLLWQAAYAELYFTETLWPEFDINELDKALVNYCSRERRFGKITKE